MSKSLAAPITLTVIGGIVVILAGVIGFVVLPNVVDNTIEKELRLTRGSDVWNKWVDIESPIYLNFYIYNVTNPDEVDSFKELPKLQELGPYAYRQRRQKIDPHSETCKETVTYEQKITYFFDKEKSGPGLSEDDVVNIVNVPFVSLLTAMYKLGPTFAGIVFNATLPNERLVRRDVKVGEVTFLGFDVSQYDHPLLTPNLPEEFSGFRFGLYKGRNESTDGLYEVHTGAAAASQFGVIKSWNGNSTLNFWGPGGKCNDLVGTDGSIFPPFLEKDSSINIFNSDLCRSLRLDFKEEVTVKDLKAYRFAPTKAVLQGPEANPANECYCLKENKTDCKDGTINVGACRNGAPIILSTPHFLDGYQEYANAVGLIPDRAKHETTIDLEIRTGLLLGAHKRIQINIEVIPLKTVSALNVSADIMFPVLWIDEEASICDIDVEDFKSRVESPVKTINIVRWVALAIGVVLIILAVGVFFLSRRRSSKHV